MTIPEAEAYRAAIIRSAADWARGEGSIDNQEELCVVADYYGVDLPLYMRHFLYSNGPDHAAASGAPASVLKGILRTLKKLRAAILKKEGQL